MQVRVSRGWQNPFNICLPDSSNCWALQGLSGWFLESRPFLGTSVKKANFASETPSSFFMLYQLGLFGFQCLGILLWEMMMVMSLPPTVVLGWKWRTDTWLEDSLMHRRCSILSCYRSNIHPGAQVYRVLPPVCFNLIQGLSIGPVTHHNTHPSLGIWVGSTARSLCTCQEPTPGLMLCRLHLEVLNKF